MDVTRREVMVLGAAGMAVALMPFEVSAATQDQIDAAVKAFTGGASPKEGGIKIDAPEIAENGNTVPVGVSAEGATEIMLIAPKNPLPTVCTFRFGPASGGAEASTRIRLAGTQDLTAYARMKDGSFATAKRTVKVTIGGCGG